MQSRRTQRYAIGHLRCMLADDLRGAGVVEGKTELEVKQLVARLYGSFLDSSLCRPEYREFYGHYGMKTYRDPFPEGHEGPNPLPLSEWSFKPDETYIPAGYLDEVERIDRESQETV
jgi:hypothetical protein